MSYEESVLITGKKKSGKDFKKKFDVFSEQISLQGKNLIEIDLAPLNKFVKLQYLDLSGNLLHTIDLSPIMNLNPEISEIFDSRKSQLRELNLSNNKLTSFDLKTLIDCEKLKKVDLSNNNLEIVDFEPLMNFSNFYNIEINILENRIKKLDLSMLEFSNFDIKYDNTTEIVWEKYWFGESRYYKNRNIDPKIRKAWEKERINRFVKTKKTDGTIVEISNITYLSKAIEKENIIELKGSFWVENMEVTEIDLTPLSFKNVHEFIRDIIITNNQLEKIDLSPISSCIHLQTLDLDCNGLKEIDLTPLSELTELVTISIIDNSFSELNLEPLIGCKKLKSIDVCGNKIVSLDLSPLLNCSSLESLSIHSSFTKEEQNTGLPKKTEVYFSKTDIKENKIPECLKDIYKNWKEAHKMGFESIERKEKAQKLGFLSKEEYEIALNLGFRTRKEWLNAQTQGFESKKDIDEFEKSKFKDVSKWKKAKKIGVTSPNELLLAEFLDVDDKSYLFKRVEEEISNYLIRFKEFEIEIHIIDTNYFSRVPWLDLEKLNEYENKVSAMIDELQKPLELREKLYKTKGEELKNISEEFKDKCYVMDNSLSSLHRSIIQYVEEINSWLDVMNHLNNYSVGQPVKIWEIKDQIQADLSETVRYIQMLVSTFPELGEYNSSENEFIRKYENDINTDEFLQKLKIREKEQLENEIEYLEKTKQIYSCIYCGNQFDLNKASQPLICIECKKESPICPICKQIIFKGEEIVKEKNCDSLFHYSHIMAWISSQEKCPICKEKINEDSLEKFTGK